GTADGLGREVVVGYTAAIRIGVISRDRVPGSAVRNHDHEPVEPADNGRGLSLRPLRPQLEVPSPLFRPIRRYVIKQVEDAIAAAELIVRVVYVRIEEVAGSHQRNPAGVQEPVGLERR